MGYVAKVFEILGPWTWWVIGLCLAAIEVFAPGSYFLWFAVAAIVVGALALTMSIGWQVQIVLFVVLAAVAVILGRRFYGNPNIPKADEHLNERLIRQVGRPAVMDTPLANGSGHIRLDDTLWRVEGPDLPAGAPVTIVGVRGGRFLVEPRPSA